VGPGRTCGKKLVGIGGGTLGSTDEKFVHDRSVLTMNVLTRGLDVFAIVRLADEPWRSRVDRQG
jgi:hypothetical protein